MESKEMTYKEYRQNYERICEMNDLRERMVQDFVIAPLLRKILPGYDIIPVDVKVPNRGKNHDYGQYCGKKNLKYWTPDLCVAENWRWNNKENCPTEYIAVVEVKSIGDDSVYIISNTKGGRDKTFKYLKDIGNAAVKHEMRTHLSANKNVIFTDGVTWYFFEKNEENLEESEAQRFKLGIRILTEKMFDHIEWFSEERGENEYKKLTERIKKLVPEHIER